MYEAQAFSTITEKWYVLKLAFTEEECRKFIESRVNPKWKTRVVRVTDVGAP